MAIGDIYSRRNASDDSTIADASTLIPTWDTETNNQGSAATYSASTFTLGVGVYLITYSDQFVTASTVTNTRFEINSAIHLSGTGAIGGYNQGYIRKSSGHQDCTVSGQMIHEVTSGTDDIFIQYERTDTSSNGTSDRVPGVGGVHIVQLDPADGFGLYKNSVSETTSTTVVRTLTTNTNVRQDSGFNNSSGVVSVTTAGYYVMLYTIKFSQTATNREELVSWISKNGTATPVIGTYGSSYIRGQTNESCQDGAISVITLVDVSANDTFQVRYNSPTSATLTVPVDGGQFQMWKIPSGMDKCVMEATTGDYNANADFTWDTLPTIDTASFTATAGTDNIVVDNADMVLAFANFHNNTVNTVQRGAPRARFKVDGNFTNTAVTDLYHRNTGGAGICGMTLSDVLIVNPTNEVSVNTEPLASTGTLTNDLGNFVLLSLGSVYGPYSPPPAITTVTNPLPDGGSATIDGFNFEASQGTGIVELWSDISGTTKVSQTVTSWSDTEIIVTVSQGSILDGIVYVNIITDGGSSVLSSSLSIGFLPYDDYVSIILPDHGWSMNNTWDDNLGTQGTNPCNVSQSTPPTFQTTPICRGSTHSLLLNNDLSHTEVADSIYTNITTLHTARDIGGWFMVDRVQQAPSAIYEEGGGVNNFYFILGYGNILLANIADSSSAPNVKVQAFSDFKLAVNRPYHILMHYESTTFGGKFEMFIDGVKQSVSTGSVDHSQMSTHSGDWSFGRPDGSLDTGGTDIQYPSAKDINLSHWATWSAAGGGSPLTDNQIRINLFESGTLSDETVSEDTVINMQSAMSVFDSSTRPDYPCAFLIYGPSDSNDLTLTLNDIVFDDRISIHFQWKGAGTLTIINSGTSNADPTKMSVLEGGSIEVINAVPIKYIVKDISDNGLIENVRVRIKASSGGDLAENTVILTGLTDSNGEIESTLVYTNDQPVTGIFRSASGTPYYSQQKFTGTITSTGLDEIVLLVQDQ